MFASRTVLMLLVVSLLSACATAPRQLDDVQFDEKLVETDLKVEALGKAGKMEEASVALTRLAALNTARKEPWSRLARMHFESGNYGAAITAADEVLQRDSSDLAAKSIRAVSGLRVAARSLVDIQKDQTLAGAARPDAQKLATLLRETLGEPVLVPPTTPVVEPPEEVRRPVRKRRVRRVRNVSPAPAAVSVPAAPARADGASANPFGALQ